MPSCRGMQRVLGAWLIGALLLIGLALPALVRAQSLASLNAQALPAWPDGAAVKQLVSVQGRLLALGDSQAWLLDEPQRQWQPVAWRLGAPPLNLVHPYFYLAISILICIVVGYAASWLFPAPTRSLKGLTIYADKG